ncbi:6-phosphofructokinase [Terriglobus tenax]|uniref:6-phosphofructokinase n=1 Tax=Terriglobus tenax TaxID=1111115 RepID=UPI0021DFFF55|nr:ATP-dependent 6-phosphofructokinase [Terriglobus tenax]
MRIGLVTAGGDCPGLNAVIRAVVQRGILHHNHEFLGFMEGWRGLVEDLYIPLDLRATEDLLTRGGTILRTSRVDIRQVHAGFARCAQTMDRHGLDALIALGGNGTQAANLILSDMGVNCIGVPKTIDNDLSGTDMCFGFDTAVNIATEAIDRLHTTAAAHNRVIVCEVMGRHTGWIAACAGIAAGAHVTLVPEVPIDIDEVCGQVQYEWEKGNQYAIVVIAEGATLPNSDWAGPTKKLGGIASALAKMIEERTGCETRSAILGHIQRGGTPSAFDRVLATRYGVAAVDLATQRRFGRMVALRNSTIVDIPLKDAVAAPRGVDPSLLEVIRGLRPPVASYTSYSADASG